MPKQPELKFKVETITPERAQADLDRSEGKNYRPKNPARVTGLATAMKEGRFELNGETVKYNCDGKLVDGQHRFAACVEAGVPFTALVVYGVKSDLNIDSGKPRKFRDFLRRAGELNYSYLASATWWLWNAENHGWGHMGYAHAPHSELQQLLKKRPTLRDSVNFVCQALGKQILMKEAFAAMHFQMNQLDPELARWFFDKLGSGIELKKFEPVRLLRDRLKANHDSKAKLSRRERIALTIKAWNATRHGRELQVLRYVGSGRGAEDFPVIE